MQPLGAAGVLDQLRQRAVARGLDLAAVLAQLGRDPGQPDGGVDRLLRVPGDALLAPEHPVLVDLQIALLGHAADDDVVRLGTGEVLERCAVALLRDHPQVDLDAVLQDHGAAGWSAGHDFLHFVVACEARHHWTVLRRYGQHVEVADRLLPPAEAAGDLHALDPLNLAQIGGKGLRVRLLLH